MRLTFPQKTDSVINVKVEFGESEGKVPLDDISQRAEDYKPKERVTYKMIKEYIEAKYGFQVHTTYIEEVKRDLGLPMYDAPNAVKELKQPRKYPTKEKVGAIKIRSYDGAEVVVTLFDYTEKKRRDVDLK